MLETARSSQNRSYLLFLLIFTTYLSLEKLTINIIVGQAGIILSSSFVIDSDIKFCVRMLPGPTLSFQLSKDF